MGKGRNVVVTAILFVLLLLAMVLSLGVGSSGIGFDDFLSGDRDAFVVLSVLRFPRILAALLAGIAFSVSGLLLQSASSNDLASPNIVGINAGAGFAVLCFLSFFPSMFRILPLVSFLGALVAATLAIVLSSLISSVRDRSTLLLSGVAISALFNAGISAVSALDPDVLATYSSFSIGGFSGVYLSDLAAPAVVIFVSIAFSFALSRQLSLLILGDEIASAHGVDVRMVRLLAVVVASALAAAAVTFSGLLGFVGLVVPHISRLIYGEDRAKDILGCILCGPILVVLADTVGRIAVPPAELPCGVFMAVLGVPFFFILLFRRRRSSW